MLNFTVGPVMSSQSILEVGSLQTPYFRTSEFSDIMFENELLVKRFAKAENNSRVLFMTCSSTGSMEAVVMNCFSSKDKLLVINGGSFGARFASICEIHRIPYDELTLSFGQGLSYEHLYQFDGLGYTGLLVNIDETSTGVLYDSEMIGEFCKKNNLFYVCDCVSSYLADPFDMTHCGANIMITGSQKALACPPGVSIIVMDEIAIERINNSSVQTMYFNLKEALIDMERGQTPFTPAVGTLLQINTRLQEIDRLGGVEYENKRIRDLALYFRSKIVSLPLELFSEKPANGVTSLRVLNGNAYDVFIKLKDFYGIWVCPNGGELKNSVFRVGHLGDLSNEDYDVLFDALCDLNNSGILY